MGEGHRVGHRSERSPDVSALAAAVRVCLCGLALFLIVAVTTA